MDSAVKTIAESDQECQRMATTSADTGKRITAVRYHLPCGSLLLFITMSGALASIEAALMTKAADVSISVVASRAVGTTLAGVTASFYAGAIIGFSVESVNKRDVIQW
jgi:hypothetical protein